MPVTRETVERVGALAGLQLTPGEADELARDLSRILDYVDRIAEVPVEGVEPLANPWIASAPLAADEPLPYPDPERLRLAAPRLEGAYFLVPLVVDRG